MPRMNILEVVEACEGGVGRHVSGLCKGLVAQGHRVTVAYSPRRVDSSFRQFIIDQRHEILFFPLKSGRRVSFAADLQSIVQLMHLIRTEGPFDVIHGHSSKGGAVARIVGRLLGVPTVYTPHSLIMSSRGISRTAAAIYGCIERFLGRWASSRIIAVSEGERDFILELGLVPKGRLALITNGINARDFELSARTKLPCDAVNNERPLTFGALMRFTPQKAPYDLIDAFCRLNRELPQTPMRLIIAGDGELFDEAKKRARESEVCDKIFLPGWKTDINNVLKDFDVYVLPSLYEAGPYTIIEAMAALLPVVATDVFGTKETIAQVSGNVIVPRGNPKALASGMRAVATLAEPRSLRRILRRIGQRNRDHALAHFTEDGTIQHTLEIYQALRA